MFQILTRNQWNLTDKNNLKLLHLPCMNIQISTSWAKNKEVLKFYYETLDSHHLSFLSLPGRTEAERQKTILIVWCSTVLFVKATNKTWGPICANNSAIYRAKTRVCTRNYELLLHDWEIFSLATFSHLCESRQCEDRESRHNLYCLMWKGSACNSLVLIFKALISWMGQRLYLTLKTVPELNMEAEGYIIVHYGSKYEDTPVVTIESQDWQTTNICNHTTRKLVYL